MKKSRILLIFIFIFSIVMVIVSCSQQNESENPDILNNENLETSAGETQQEQTIYDILPKKDFGGDTFTIYIPPNPDSPVEKGTYVESMTGETFNDVVYERNARIEAEYNVKIQTIYGNTVNSTYDDMKKYVLAGDHAADLYFIHLWGSLPSIATDGLARQWIDVPYVDFDKPWWYQSAIKNLNIANKVYFASSAMSIDDVLVILFNKSLLQNLALEDPYKLVREGKWTIDKLSEMAVAATEDLNGDGQFDYRDDRFGLEFGTLWQTPSLMSGCGIVYVTLDDNGYPTFNLDSPKAIDVYEKIYNLLYQGDKTYCYTGNTPETWNTPHIGVDSGRVLFCQWNLFNCELLRGAETDYGILPFPKYDERQEKYWSNSWTGTYCIPSTLPDEKLDMVGIVTEAMSATGYSDILPVYYGNVLFEKLVRDDESRDMLNIIFSGILYDAGISLDLSMNPSSPAQFIRGLYNNDKTPDFVSALDKVKDRMSAGYVDLYNRLSEEK